MCVCVISYPVALLLVSRVLAEENRPSSHVQLRGLVFLCDRGGLISENTNTPKPSSLVLVS